ncbi:MAG TPA: FAD-linked oxidase C-terminal domain-containing protein, partial [Bryobacteraceae bacterium]|nr:FAD-linked oxidase C-terminal domain-containing protein [Bryobacteraceae bacterium]
GCGLLWCARVAPIAGSEARVVCRIATETLLAHGFEPMISLTLVTERALACIITIAFDRAVAGEDEKAMSCYRELLSKLARSGYHSYRLGIQSMSEMNGDTGYNRLMQQLKQAVDPKQILSPGRYEARANA